MQPSLIPEPPKPADFDRRMAAINRNVRVVWKGELGVWEIQELGRATGTWQYVMLWAIVDPSVTPKPKYLPLPSPEQVMAKLHELDVTRLGSTPAAQWGVLCANMDENRKDWLAKHFAELDSAGREYAGDMCRLGNLGRRHFGPGAQRGKLRLGYGSDNMRRFMAQKARNCAFPS